MVTAIVIPIICIYFYFLTKREMKQNKTRWLESGQVKEESVLVGVIENISHHKERYYRNHFVMITKLQIRSNEKLHVVQFTTPMTNDWELPPLKNEQYVTFYGTWNQSILLANRFVA
ncbi:hypothetical protein [Peribacillus acanthi]|uniref:hypothetical protein n=1 Tax=Peribacillus acanthi TaxID=2171554 RepID=UPI000D3E7BB7|nr:hypothetical protein [Peribacillus acanthi]